jgi:hypothetical protein
MYRLFLLLFLLIGSYAFSQNAQTTITLTAGSVSVTSYSNKEVIIPGKTDLHIIGLSNQLNNSIVRLNSENAWLFIDNMRPSVVKDSILSKVYVNNALAKDSTNVRVCNYKQGTVIIPHNYSYKPLTVYTGQNYTGDSVSYALYTRYEGLGAVDNKIRSFKLKRGYMATLANASDGTGYSRVFIADKEDILVPVLNYLLDQSISFIRTFDWHWTTKKGWAGGPVETDQTNSTWRYDWGAGGLTTCNLEYSPIRVKLNYPGYNAIWNGTGFNNVLSLNEPDHPEQHKDDNGGNAVTVAQAIAQWPDLMKSGLRLGTPACTSFSWLYSFLDSCKARNYRVDFVAIHSYWGGMSASSWYSNLKYIHDRSGGLPIWITEWNNGANWTTESWTGGDPETFGNDANMNKQLNDIKAITNVLDTAHFIERYSIYNWVGYSRQMILTVDSTFMAKNPGYTNYAWLKTAPVLSSKTGKLLNGTSGIINTVLTPAGQYYKSNVSSISFNRVNEIIPSFKFDLTPSLTFAPLTKTGSLTINDSNGDYYRGIILEKKDNGGNYTEFFNSDDPSIKTITENLDLTPGNSIKYRAKCKLANNIKTNYATCNGYDVTTGTETQYGKISTNTVGWNPVYFNTPYAAIPAIITGGITNNNSALLTARVKLTSYSSRFNIQLAPWNYQAIGGLNNEDSVSYFATTMGSHNYGGLNALAGKVVVAPTWTPVTFSTPFDSIPVVFVNQLIPGTLNATVVRVRNVSKTGFEAKIMKESAVTSPLNSETVSYLAISTGKGTVNNKKIIVGRTSSTAVSPSTTSTISFGETITNPVFITQLQTCNDDTVTANIRCTSITSIGASLIKQREKSTTATIVSNDGAGWIAIAPADITETISPYGESQLEFYPNPVADRLYLKQNQNLSAVRIYDICGVQCKQFNAASGVVDVSDLKSGYYILVADGVGRAKFMKK